MKVIYVTKEFDEHRCTPNPVMRNAHWLNGLTVAFRFYPQIESAIDTDTPPETRVFHCTDCKLIALAPGKASR